uniref:glutathione S-transferase T3-like n=1 Tax=Erigeron canadensis TaxID=72917 RepID=UPI001CB99D6F|nr:glutathione S-transferase T3-like [Erigeron canadensis]
MDPKKTKKNPFNKSKYRLNDPQMHANFHPNQFMPPPNNPPLNQFYSQSSQSPPNQYSQPLPNQSYSNPSPYQFSQPSTPSAYYPQPASPQMFGYGSSPSTQTNAHFLNMARMNDFIPIEEDVHQDDEEVEIVAETQQDDVQKDDNVQEVQDCGKKTKTKRENWTPAQEVALAQAWVQISECKKYGNEQKADGFWRRVLEHYTTLVGPTTRTIHGLTPKWKQMNATMGLFNGLYNQAKQAKGSGCNDLDIMRVAMADFKTRTKKEFPHHAAWDVVKIHDKWAEQKCFQIYQDMGPSRSDSSKRKSGEYETASTGHFIPDMNEDPNPPLEAAAKKGKKKASASGSASSTVADDISEYAKRKTRYLDEKHETDERRARQRDILFFHQLACSYNRSRDVGNRS